MAADGGAASYDRSGARIQYRVVCGDRRGWGRGSPVAAVSQGTARRAVFGIGGPPADRAPIE